jgi:hypothetical protein
MFRKLVIRFSKWIHKKSGEYCYADMDKDAEGLAKCLVRPPPTKAEKAERLREAILRNVDEADQDKALKHFELLSQETDPHADNEEICVDSVKKIGIDPPSVDEVAKTFDAIDHAKNRKRAVDALRGFDSWPSDALVSNKRSGKDKNDE